MFWKNMDPEVKKQVIAFSVSGVIIVSFYLICNNLRIVGNAISSIFSSMMPFIIGILFALILVPIRRIIENKWLCRAKLSRKAKRRVSVALSMLFLLAIIVGFFSFLIPQLVASISSFAKNLDAYTDSVSHFISSMGSDNEVASVLNNALDSAYNVISGWLVGNKGGFVQIVSYSVTFVKNIINFFIGLIVTMYLLLQEEIFKKQVKKFLYATLKEKHADACLDVCRLTAEMFNKFIFGKALDSLIIGIACYIVVNILDMPYAPLISFTIGITNMIPVFGPFIGAIPCLILLVIINPWKALEFLIFIFILQQIDGNLLGPYILGDSLGLPTLWVMFAIIVGGALFGIAGMFLGVPVFSVIYTLVSRTVNSAVRDKKIDVETK